MVRRWTDAEDYREGMESIDSDVMDRVLAATREYEPDSYTETDVRRAMSGPVDPEGVKITLACTECKQRNYNTMKNKKNNPDRLEMNKYCPFCRKHTLHKESK